MALDLDKIRTTADRVAGSYGLEVVDAELVGGGKHRVLRVSIEKDAAGRARLAAEAKAAAGRGDAGLEDVNQDGALPAAVLRGELSTEHLSGVTHEDCERFSHDFGTVIDVEDLVPGAEYTLEVSSPGLDRKLSRAADYERFRGSLVKLQTFQPVAGNRHWQGRLTAASDDKITLDRSAIQAKGKAKKTAAAADALVEIEIGNIEKANLIPEL
jgi:ribosome maturation factor RimP